MADLPKSAYPRIADPQDLPRLISGDNVEYTWPPPGTTVVPIATPSKWVVVYGEPSEGDADTWWVTDLGTIAGYFPGTALGALRYVSNLAVGNPVLLWAGALSHVPVIYSQSSGGFMQWIRATMRGTLGGTAEQFQHKFDLGVPGDDPTLDEADAPALATQLAGFWSTAFNSTQSNGLSLKANCATIVKYVEVGVAQFHQDNAGSTDDPEGDRTQDYPAGWFAWAVGSQPTGTGGNSLPYEVSCAVTFQTDTRGPRGRGRIYLPPFGTGSLESNGNYATAVALATGEAVGDFFNSIRGSTPYVPIVVSSRAKQLHEITSINVGTVADSQRRRRRSLDEARVTYWTAA